MLLVLEREATYLEVLGDLSAGKVLVGRSRALGGCVCVCVCVSDGGRWEVICE